MTHDPVADDFTSGSFDLIHIRAVLEHLAQRERGWLAPEDAVVVMDSASSPARDLVDRRQDGYSNQTDSADASQRGLGCRRRVRAAVYMDRGRARGPWSGWLSPRCFVLAEVRVWKRRVCAFIATRR